MENTMKECYWFLFLFILRSVAKLCYVVVIKYVATDRCSKYTGNSFEIKNYLITIDFFKIQFNNIFNVIKIQRDNWSTIRVSYFVFKFIKHILIVKLSRVKLALPILWKRTLSRLFQIVLPKCSIFEPFIQRWKPIRFHIRQPLTQLRSAKTWNS